ncbi:MAG TPA: outer membrane lipoprotein-sorting protein [bacterium (Candidatus Stahlbacteria)]|nr:outer membrane lipoprotein-sorting protein [Candidatus Stahlbacteria bacterium]
MFFLLLIIIADLDSILARVEVRSRELGILKGRMEVVFEYPGAETLIGRFYLKNKNLLMRIYSPNLQDFLITDTMLIIYNPEFKEKIIKRGTSPINRPVPYIDMGPGILGWMADWQLEILGQDSIHGYDLYIMEGKNNDTMQTYQRSLIWIDSRSYLIRRVEFYDRDSLLNFVYLVHADQSFGEVIIPKEYEMRILTDFGVIVFSVILSALEIPPELPDSLFRVGG